MDFELNEEQRMFRDSLRKFLDAEVRSLDDRWGYLEMTAERAKPLLKMLIPWGYVGTEGILSIGSEPIITCVKSEELSATFPGLAGMSGITSGAAALIDAGAHPELARRLVAALSQGDLIGCSAITEPEAGSDPSGIRTRAERKGGHWVINGAKSWISNGSVADVAVVLAQTDPAKGPAGFRYFVVERQESPFESREIPTIGLRSLAQLGTVLQRCQSAGNERARRMGQRTAVVRTHVPANACDVFADAPRHRDDGGRDRAARLRNRA